MKNRGKGRSNGTKRRRRGQLLDEFNEMCWWWNLKEKRLDRPPENLSWKMVRNCR